MDIRRVHNLGADIFNRGVIPYTLLIIGDHQTVIGGGAVLNTIVDESDNDFIFTPQGTKAIKDSAILDGAADTIGTQNTAAAYDSDAGVDQFDLFPSGTGTMIVRFRGAGWNNFFTALDPIINTRTVPGPDQPTFQLGFANATTLRFSKFSTGTLYNADRTIAMSTWYTAICRFDNDVTKLKVVGVDGEGVNTAVNKPIDSTSTRIRLFQNTSTGGHLNGNTSIIACVDGMQDDDYVNEILADLGL